MTVHFKTAGAAAFLDGGLGELENICAGLDEVWGPAAALLHEQLQSPTSVTRRTALTESFLLSRKRTQPSAEIAAALRAVESNPAIRISQVSRVPISRPISAISTRLISSAISVSSPV